MPEMKSIGMIVARAVLKGKNAFKHCTSARSVILTAMLMKVQGFSDCTPCRLVNISNVSLNPSASLFKVKRSKCIWFFVRNLRHEFYFRTLL